ncbi:hypothetical protein Dimus_028009 [Dionaea muscipula]
MEKTKTKVESAQQTNATTSLEFFRVFVPDFTSQHMLIPAAIERQLDLPPRIGRKKAVLRNQTRATWYVNLVKEDNNMSFTGGWPEFAKDNRLQLGEFILFSYKGNLTFDVKIYGTNGCSKAIDQSSYGGAADQQKQYHSPPVVLHVKKESMSMSMSSKLYRDQRFKSHRRQGKGSVERMVMDDDDPEGSKSMIQRKRVLGRPRKKKYSMLSLVPSSKLGDHKYARLDAAAGGSYVPKFPFFVATMTNSYIKSGGLHVPSKFVNEHFGARNNQVVKLQVEDKLWPMNLNYYGSWKFTFGWSDFARGNKLQVGDVCFFELLNKADHDHGDSTLFKVSIFRSSW